MLAEGDIDSQGFFLNNDFQGVLHSTSEKVSSQEEILSKEENSNDHVHDVKYTMENLCKSFLKKYANTCIAIEPSLISTEFNAKLRRVYDLTNILEGGGIIQKVEKGVYKWKGLEKRNQLSIKMQKNDWCSLRSISFQIKKLFNKMKKGLTCNDLHMILTNGSKNRFNPATIRRKIYECCKVFVNVGLIKKSGKYFYSGEITEKEIQSLKMLKIQQQIMEESQKIKSSKSESLKIPEEQINVRQTKYLGIQNIQRKNSINLQQRKAIIRKVVSEFENQSDLTKFIEEINQEYRSRKLKVLHQSKEESKSLLFDKKTECLETQQWSPRSTNQLQRNIIISSPPKDLYPQLFAFDGIKCMLTPYPNMSSFEPLQDIKGK